MSVKRLLTTLILAMAISATAASAASARPIDAVGASVSDPAAYATTDETASVEQTSSSSSSGFDWGDAGIGAGAMFAVTMIGLGGVLGFSGRRHRQPGSPAAV